MRAEVIDILTRNTTLKDKPLCGQVVMPSLNPDGTVNKQSLAQDQDYYISAGLQEGRVNIDELVNPSFAAEAARQLGAS